MGKVILTIIAFCLGLSVWGQPQMKFDKEVVHLGTVLWSNPVVTTFHLTNSGTAPLNITQVNSSCACTVASWTQTPIPPGQQGEIVVFYDAKALGTFYKEVEVFSNATSQPVYLGLQGKTVPTDKDMVITETYDNVMGDVMLSKSMLFFDEVRTGSHPMEEIRLVNTGRAAFEPLLMHVPEYLEVVAVPKRIPAGKSGRLQIRLRPDLIHDVGLVQTSIYLSRYFGDKVSDENEIPVSAIVLPELSNTESKLLPQLTLSSEELVLPNDKNKLTIWIGNMGKAVLKIDRLQVFSPAITADIAKTEIKPGGKTKMKITVNRKRMKRTGQLRVLMITNDPQHTGQLITIKTE